jgi:proliferating cell nuclear antigen PCNA
LDTDKKKDDENNEEKKTEKKKNVGGIRIIALDQYKTLLIYVRLNSDEFEEFYVKPKTLFSIGLDLVQLHKFMKTVDKDSIMTIKIEKDDEQHVKFELSNSLKNSVATYEQKVMDIDDDPTKLPVDTSFEMSVAMDTTDFKKICQEMSNFAEHVEITCTPRDIKFRCEADSSAYEKTFKSSETTGVRILCPEKDNKKDKLIMVQAIYNLKHLVTFGKCVNLCTEMQLFLKNDYPLFINYPIGNIGKMLVGLSPVDSNTLKRDADYDDTNDKYYSSKKAVIKEA